MWSRGNRSYLVVSSFEVSLLAYDPIVEHKVLVDSSWAWFAPFQGVQSQTRLGSADGHLLLGWCEGERRLAACTLKEREVGSR